MPGPCTVPTPLHPKVSGSPMPEEPQSDRVLLSWSEDTVWMSHEGPELLSARESKSPEARATAATLLSGLKGSKTPWTSSTGNPGLF